MTMMIFQATRYAVSLVPQVNLVDTCVSTHLSENIHLRIRQCMLLTVQQELIRQQLANLLAMMQMLDITFQAQHKQVKLLA